MNRVGEVVGAAQGLAVLRSPDAEPPDIGTPVLTAELSELGRVVDVFGPAEHPYVAVSPNESDQNLAALVGSPLYART